MKKLIFLSFSILITLIVFGQSYQIGYKTITFIDASRDNRQIETVVYYPANTSGENVAIADGSFPAIVFGHGFSMGDETLYQYLWDGLVPEGYICLFPLTEGGGTFSPPWHEEFGLDLKFLNVQIKAEGSAPASFFYNKVSDKTAIMGHSMGGKAAYIGSANNTDLTTLVSLTAAMSDPPWPYSDHGYDAMSLSVPFITVPTLVVDAEIDCVVPEDEGHQVIYNNLLTDCKTYVNILGGGHCYMASGESDCETGEGWIGGNCSGDFTITRQEQNNIVLQIILPYFDYMLKDNSSAEDDFLNYIETSTDVTYLRNCPQPDPQIAEIDVYNGVQNITVPYATPENIAISQLVSSISIGDSDGGIHAVNLNWTVDAYNANQPAIYNATGTFELPAGVIQTTPPTSLSVAATITVLEYVSISQWGQSSGFIIYPNPADNKLYYEIGNNSATSEICLYNIYGVLLKRISPSANGYIDISDLSTGVYLVKFNNSTLKLNVE